MFACSAGGAKIGFGFDGSITHLERNGVSEEMRGNFQRVLINGE